MHSQSEMIFVRHLRAPAERALECGMCRRTPTQQVECDPPRRDRPGISSLEASRQVAVGSLNEPKLFLSDDVLDRSTFATPTAAGHHAEGPRVSAPGVWLQNRAGSVRVSVFHREAARPLQRQRRRKTRAPGVVAAGNRCVAYALGDLFLELSRILDSSMKREHPVGARTRPHTVRRSRILEKGMTMRKRIRGLARVCAASAAVGLLAPTGSVASEVDEAIRLRAAGNVSSAKSQETIDELSDEADALLQQYRQLLQQIDALKTYNRQIEDLLAAQAEEASSLQGQIDQVALVGRQLTPLMLRMIEALEAFVQADLPFLLEERTSRVAHLGELMGRADVSSSEKFRRILEAYQIENEYGRTIEAYQGEIQVNGTTRTVEFLRVGRIGLLYQTLDGAEVGAWNAGTSQWEQIGGEYRIPIRHGLKIARKQAAPDLIRLPIASAAGDAK